MVECRTPEREVGVRSSLRPPCCVLEQDTLTSQKVLVIHRKRWIRPDMTENLFTGTLSKTETKTKTPLTCITSSSHFYQCLNSCVSANMPRKTESVGWEIFSSNIRVLGNRSKCL